MQEQLTELMDSNGFVLATLPSCRLPTNITIQHVLNFAAQKFKLVVNKLEVWNSTVGH